MRSVLNIITSILLITAASCLCATCSSNSDEPTTTRELHFIGDSHVKLWDVASWFPTYSTYNYGISGTGIAHIQNYADHFIGKDVVVIVGTNDLKLFTDQESEQYVKNYVQALEDLGAHQLFLFSIFPKSKELCKYTIDDNNKARRVNALIKQAIVKKSFIYIDVYDLLDSDGYMNPAYSDDGQHLSQTGYELITKQLMKVL